MENNVNRNIKLRTALAGTICFLLSFLLFPHSGCEKADQSTVSIPSNQSIPTVGIDETLQPSTGQTTRNVLADAIEAYSRAKFYTDKGRVEIVYELDKDEKRQMYTEPCSTSFAKPNYIDLHIGTARIHSDGVAIRATIEEQSFNDSRIESSAPNILTSITELYFDAELMRAARVNVSDEIFWTSPQLIFLFANDPLKTLFPTDAQTTLLNSAYLDQNGVRRLCERIQVEDETGVRTFWFDCKTKILARCELPVEKINAPFPHSRVISAIVDFPAQKISDVPPIDLSPFTFDKEEDRNVVKRFTSSCPIEPRQHFPTEALRPIDTPSSSPNVSLGRQTFIGLWRVEDSDDARLDFFQTLTSLANVVEQNNVQSENRSNVIAVNCDRSNVPDEIIRSVANSSKLISSFRLNEELLSKIDLNLAIIPSPALLEVDSNSTILRFFDKSSSVNNSRPVLFPKRAVANEKQERLLSMELSLANERDLYRITSEMLTENQNYQKRSPQTFGLREIWRINNLKSSGSPAIIATSTSQAETEELAALAPCDGNALAPISSQGRLFRKTKSISAVDDVISYVKTTSFSSNKRFFVASSENTDKIYRFDDKLNDLGTLDLSRFHCKVGDLAMVESNGKSMLIFTALREGVDKIYAVDMLTREIYWKIDAYLELGRIEIITRHNEKFALVVEKSDNKSERMVAVDVKNGEQRAVYQIQEGDVIEDFATINADVRLVVLTRDRNNATFLTGFNEQGERLWRSRVGGDINSRPKRIVSGDVDNDSVDEIFAVSTTGTVYILKADGKAFDFMQFGKGYLNLSFASWNGKNILFVMEENSARAFEIESKRRTSNGAAAQ